MNKDNKIYILSFCSVVLYAIIISLINIPFTLFGISIDNLSINYINSYKIIYQVLAISSSLLFFFYWLKKPLKETSEQLKLYGIGLGSILIYFLFSSMQLLPFQLLNINIETIPIYLKIIYLLCYEALLIGIIILINLKKLKKDINDIKNHHNKYFKNCLKYWLIALFVMYVSNFAISLLGSGLPENEQIVRQQFQISPLYIYISAVIFAPILEELIFRQSIRNLIRNKWLFIIISGLVFGGMHVFTSEINSFVDILYLIPYSAPGIAFAYMLYKTENIFVSMGFHFLHNGISMALQFFMIYFL